MIVMNHAAAAQAQEITHKIRAIVQGLKEYMFRKPPSGSGQGHQIAEQCARGHGREEHARNDIKSDGRTVDSRIMARPPPGTCANRLAPGRGHGFQLAAIPLARGLFFSVLLRKT